MCERARSVDLIKRSKRGIFQYMNRSFSRKLPSWVLLFVMLINPIIGVAGSLVLEKSNHDILLVDMSANTNESCHESSVTGVMTTEEGSIQKHSECCDEPCMCGHGGCHSPLAAVGSAEASITAGSIGVYANVSSYHSPTLNSQNPPPII